MSISNSSAALPSSTRSPRPEPPRLQYLELKANVHRKLLNRLNLEALANAERSRAEAEIRTLLFDLHNRHTYSEEEVKAGRGFAMYSAIIGILTMEGELLGRGAVRSEVRTAKDLFERITGGAGPGGVKAVAPAGREEVTVMIPPKVQQVSLLGEVLNGTTAAGREVSSPGRPVAIVSNVRVEYQPAPVKR